MNNIAKGLVTLVACSSIFLACKHDAGTGSSSSLKMMLSDSAASAKLQPRTSHTIEFSDGATTFTITEARMNIRDIRFNTSTTAGNAEDYTVPGGPYVMNLIDGTALPQNISFDAPTGNYKRVDIRLDESNIEDGVVTTGDALLGNALVVKGTHNYNGVTDGTFTLTVKVSEDIRFEPTNGIVVDTDAGANVTLTFNVTDWLEDPDAANAGTKIDLTGCIASAGLMDSKNHITLDEGTQCESVSASIGNIIKDNMKNRYDFN
ncbi:MAG: hypothetical protein OEZ43_08710 [Gammaproteobacteria bacterium]|nr:hypothetical protein [Gammaproteobacteria bacterium]